MAKETTIKGTVGWTGARLQDPICGRRLASAPAELSAEYKKRRYYFCSARCKDEFQVRTERFRLMELARSGALFTPGRVRWGLG